LILGIQNISVHSRLENCPNVSDVSFNSGGKLFHDDGPAAEKLRGRKPTIRRNQIIYRPISEERRWQGVEIANTVVIIDTRYNMEPADAGIYGRVDADNLFVSHHLGRQTS